MRISISRLLVPTAVERAEIEYLDEVCFPIDDRCDPSVGEWWVARDERQRIVGYSSAKPYEGNVFLARAGVLPEARGHGVQLRMIRTRLRWARRLGYATAFTYTMPDNTASSNNLIRAGFLTYAPWSWWAGPAAVYWQRKMR